MLTESDVTLRRRAEALHNAVARHTPAEVVEGESEVGGGSFPGTKLKTWLVRLTADKPTADGWLARLRAADPPVIARIEEDRVVLDARTIRADELGAVERAVVASIDG
jgi:L-seryl-tRNA(Ser) seleniumtransferase